MCTLITAVCYRCNEGPHTIAHQTILPRYGQPRRQYPLFLGSIMASWSMIVCVLNTFGETRNEMNSTHILFGGEADEAAALKFFSLSKSGHSKNWHASWEFEVCKLSRMFLNYLFLSQFVSPISQFAFLITFIPWILPLGKRTYGYYKTFKEKLTTKGLIIIFLFFKKINDVLEFVLISEITAWGCWTDIWILKVTKHGRSFMSFQW